MSTMSSSSVPAFAEANGHLGGRTTPPPPSTASTAVSTMDVGMDLFAEPLTGFNFPEMLAGDLGKSEAIFRSRNLTAGAPTTELADDGSKKCYSLRDSSEHHLQSLAHDDMSQGQSLQTPKPRASPPLTQPETQPRKRSDSVRSANSMHSANSVHSASSDCSGAMEPPSIRTTRDVSVPTSHSHSPATSAEPTPGRKHANDSWIDLDLDDILARERRHSMSHISLQPPLPLSQPPSPARTVVPDDLRSISMGSKLSPAKPTNGLCSAFNAPPKLPPHLSRTTTSPIVTKQLPGGPLIQPAEVPTRRSSLRATSMPRIIDLPMPTRTPPSPDQPDNSNFAVVPPMGPPTPPEKEFRPRHSQESDSMFDQEDDYQDLTDFSSQDQVNGLHIVSSPQIQIEEWLNSSMDLGSSHKRHPSSEFGTRIPVPSEVLDTLRVSVQCFPETMLLCSSFSIETLRGHSRKFKYGTVDLTSESEVSLALPPASQPQRPSKWKWLTSKVQPDPTSPKNQPRSQPYPEAAVPAMSPVRPGDSDWRAIRKIFPNGSDYLCDALYAHIVAYNYITSLCPRTPILVPPATPRPASRPSSRPKSVAVSRPTSRPTSKSSYSSSTLGSDLSPARSRASESTRVPRKAASILGMHTDTTSPTIPFPEFPTAANSRTSTMVSSNKKSFAASRRPTDSTKAFGSAANRSADDHDASLKELRLGLAKCVARLVATLRVTSSEPSPDGSPKKNVQVDPFFIRSLCELVRACEEGDR